MVILHGQKRAMANLSGHSLCKYIAHYSALDNGCHAGEGAKMKL